MVSCMYLIAIGVSVLWGLIVYLSRLILEKALVDKLQPLHAYTNEVMVDLGNKETKREKEKEREKER